MNIWILISPLITHWIQWKRKYATDISWQYQPLTPSYVIRDINWKWKEGCFLLNNFPRKNVLPAGGLCSWTKFEEQRDSSAVQTPLCATEGKHWPEPLAQGFCCLLSVGHNHPLFLSWLKLKAATNQPLHAVHWLSILAAANSVYRFGLFLI